MNGVRTRKAKTMTKALIDADVLRYELGAITQKKDEDGIPIALSEDYMLEVVDNKIKRICEDAWADEKPTLFLTMDRALHDRRNNRRDKKGKAICEYKPNFREAIATLKPYKGNRKGLEKPLHYDNITEYLLANYTCIVAEGMEADDMLSITQTSYIDAGMEGATIICTRDKDLRMVKGNHFGWACGKQDQFGPHYVRHIGEITPVYKKDGDDKVVGIRGTGLKFFNSQLLTGDTVDNIPGIPGVGVAKAYKLLKGLSLEEMEQAVGDAYRRKYDDAWRVRLLEQGRLLWMTTHLDKKGLPDLWQENENYLERK